MQCTFFLIYSINSTNCNFRYTVRISVDISLAILFPADHNRISAEKSDVPRCQWHKNHKSDVCFLTNNKIHISMFTKADCKNNTYQKLKLCNKIINDQP